LCITELRVIEQASAHLIGNDNCTSDGLFNRSGVADRCLHSHPVDRELGRMTARENAWGVPGDDLFDEFAHQVERSDVEGHDGGE